MHHRQPHLAGRLCGHSPDPPRALLNLDQVRPQDAAGEWFGRVVPSLWKEPPQDLRDDPRPQHLLTSGGFSECSISNSILRIHMVKAEEIRQISGWCCGNGTQRILRHEQACSCASSLSSCFPDSCPLAQLAVRESRDQAGMSCLLSKASFLSNQ